MKKRMSEKKNSNSWVGYCPFPNLGHDTVHCIVTQQAERSSHSHDTARTWPDWATATRPARAQGRAARARARPSCWGVSRYRAARLRYGRGHDHDTVCCAHDTAKEAATRRLATCAGRRCDKALQSARAHSDTAGHNHDTADARL